MTAALDALVESAKLSTSTGAGAHPQVKHVDQKNVPTHQMMSPCYAYIMFAMRVCVCVCALSQCFRDGAWIARLYVCVYIYF